MRFWFAKTLLTAVHCSESLASALLEAAFDQLYEGAATKRLPWLRWELHEVGRGESDQAIQILLDHLRLRVPDRLYRCPSTGTFWPRSILGGAPLRGCLGQLQELSDAEADNDRRWGRARRELREFPIFAMGLWGEEHSAQLSPQENKRRQFLFKDGVRNLLSSTTTMELGIDIGGLNGVVLGNVPPGRANHMQRAGRAGWRSDGSSVVVTFARNRAFDREVFVRFRDFLRRPLRRPLVFLDRPRFVRRHLHAMLLSEFFAPMQSDRTGAMLAYSNMGSLCGVDVPPKWSDSTKPDWSSSGFQSAQEFTRFLEPIHSSLHPFRQRCRSVVQDTPLDTIIDSDGVWREFLLEAEAQFLAACNEWQKDYDSLRRLAYSILGVNFTRTFWIGKGHSIFSTPYWGIRNATPRSRFTLVMSPLLARWVPTTRLFSRTPIHPERPDSGLHRALFRNIGSELHPVPLRGFAKTQWPGSGEQPVSVALGLARRAVTLCG